MFVESNDERAYTSRQKSSLGRKQRRKAERVTKRLKNKEKPRQDGKYEEEEAYAENDSSLSSDDAPVFSTHEIRTRDEHLNRKRSQSQTLLSAKSRTNPAQGELSHYRGRNATNILSKEDKDISALERKLGIGGNKAPKVDEEDGLEDLLIGLGASSESEGSSQSNVPEELTSLKRKRNKVDRKVISKRVKTVDENDESESESFYGLSLDGAESSGRSNSKTLKKNEYEVLRNRKIDNRSRTRENPYIAPSTDDMPAEIKYTPPSLEKNPELDTNMRRQLQGLLNRLAEANLITVFREAEKKYWNNPRQSVTSMLTELILDSIADEVALNETFLVLQAAFATSMYRAIGTDFGAHMIDCIVRRIDKQYNKSKISRKGKECLNLITFLTNLFIFNFIGSNLIFDYVRIFLRSVTELNTELLLRIVKSEFAYKKSYICCFICSIHSIYHNLMNHQRVELSSVRVILWH